ncbi:hypothetical protein CK203_030198 [Vitis vinifera]|uniref:DUF4220 domain-containing protein n=1 Tax=Vitis vinifera TaxID=29760 RepID=A0A438I5R3_VITVI|nr:hypothetical protein CK203_030198 [Vitis vinifera]
MFKAGLIKYLDRTLYLMSSSNARFTKSVIRWLRDKGDKGDDGGCGDGCDDGGGSDEDDDGDEGDEEPGDAAFMAEYDFKKAEGCHVSCQPEIKKPEVVIIPCPAPRNKSIPEAAILRKADKFFPKFKPLFANLGLESTVLRKSKSSFQNLSWTEAFGVTEIELGFVYDIFYTNAADNKRGVLSRFICLSFLLEFYSIILLCSSDQTRNWLSKQEKTRVNLLCQAISSCRVTFLFPENNRWSNSMAQYSLISYSLKNLNKFSEVWKFFSICPELEERSSKNSNVVPKYLKTLIFEQLQEKSRLSWSIGEEFDENILLWHVATEICCYTDLNKNSIPVKNPNREASKLLSDYLLHLLVKRPHMLPNGIGQIRFQDSSADATDFFRSGKHIKDRIQACEKLLQVNTEILQRKVKGDKKRKTEEEWKCEKKWEMMSHVWIEMLCHAACQCPSNHHAEGLTQGGELLTHVWLLMAHFGITEHIQAPRSHTRMLNLSGVFLISIFIKSYTSYTRNPPLEFRWGQVQIALGFEISKLETVILVETVVGYSNTDAGNNITPKSAILHEACYIFNTFRHYFAIWFILVPEYIW